MATTKTTKARKSAERASTPKPPLKTASQDAIDLLIADHREVDGYFTAY